MPTETPRTEAVFVPHDHEASGCEYPCDVVAGTPEQVAGLTSEQRISAEWYRRGYVDGSAEATRTALEGVADVLREEFISAHHVWGCVHRPPYMSCEKKADESVVAVLALLSTKEEGS